MENYNSYKFTKLYSFQDIDKNTSIFYERDPITQIVQQTIVKYYKFRDKRILSKMTIRQLKNLIKRCEEVIKDKESEVKS